MEPAMMSTMSALTGTIIGGVTTLASSWLTRTAQARSERSIEHKGKREDHYGRFIEEAMRLSRLSSTSGPDDFVAIRSMHVRILLLGSDEVVALGEQIIEGLEQAVISPASDAKKVAVTRLHIKAFAQACRKELSALRR